MYATAVTMAATTYSASGRRGTSAGNCPAASPKASNATMTSTLQFTPIRIPLIRPKLKLCP